MAEKAESESESETVVRAEQVLIEPQGFHRLSLRLHVVRLRRSVFRLLVGGFPDRVLSAMKEPARDDGDLVALKPTSSER